MNIPKRILYADDNEDSCTMMLALLRHLGYQVMVAQTVAAALELAMATRFDLYVVDNHFPDGTGVELCRQIRSFDAATPLIIYSGTSTQADLEEGLQSGAQAYILKPHIEDLLVTIGALLSG
ncbi:MAG: response regulator transcription factor [Blastocatellia bacterium]